MAAWRNTLEHTIALLEDKLNCKTSLQLADKPQSHRQVAVNVAHSCAFTLQADTTHWPPLGRPQGGSRMVHAWPCSAPSLQLSCQQAVICVTMQEQTYILSEASKQFRANRGTAQAAEKDKQVNFVLPGYF